MSHNAKAEARKKRLEERNRADLRSVMSTPEGRRFIWYLLNVDALVFSASYHGKTEGALFNEGRRAVGIAILNRAQVATRENYAVMMGEALADDLRAGQDEPAPNPNQENSNG